MPTHLAKLLVAVALVLGCAAPLSASIQVGDKIKLYDGVGSPGGIFKVDDLNDPNPVNQTYDFLTYCVEITEFVSFNTKYAVQSIGLVTIQGGKTLSSYTAWLYNSFLNGTLNGFSPSNMYDANALQLAIWKSIGYSESDVKYYIGTSWYNAYNPVLLGKTWASDFSNSGWTGYGGVQIMNLRGVDSYGNYTKYAQDQLVRFPPPPGQEPVPEAASFMIWSLLVSFGTIAIGRRRS